MKNQIFSSLLWNKFSHNLLIGLAILMLTFVSIPGNSDFLSSQINKVQADDWGRDPYFDQISPGDYGPEIPTDWSAGGFGASDPGTSGGFGDSSTDWSTGTPMHDDWGRDPYFDQISPGDYGPPVPDDFMAGGFSAPTYDTNAGGFGSVDQTAPYPDAVAGGFGAVQSPDYPNYNDAVAGGFGSVQYPAYSDAVAGGFGAVQWPDYSPPAPTVASAPTYNSPTYNYPTYTYPTYTYPSTVYNNTRDITHYPSSSRDTASYPSTNTTTYAPYSYYNNTPYTYTDNSRYTSKNTDNSRYNSTSSTRNTSTSRVDSQNDSHDIVGSFNDDHSLDNSFNREGFNTSISDSRDMSYYPSTVDSFNQTTPVTVNSPVESPVTIAPTYPTTSPGRGNTQPSVYTQPTSVYTQPSGVLLESNRGRTTTTQPVYTTARTGTTYTTTPKTSYRVVTSQAEEGPACPTGTTEDQDEAGQTICIVDTDPASNESKGGAKPVVTQSEPKVVAAVENDTDELPKTGAPLALAGLAGLLPLVKKLRKNSGEVSTQAEESANFIWEQRQLDK